MALKICSSCKEEKDESCFTPRKNRPCGFQSQCKVCRKEKQKFWRKNNPMYSFEYSNSNKEKLYKANALWYSNNKSWARQSSSKRRAVESLVPDLMPDNWWTILLDICENKCCKCPSRDKLTHDHVVPLTWIGSVHSLINSQVLCSSCNSGKKNLNSNDYRTPEQIIKIMYEEQKYDRH